MTQFRKMIPWLRLALAVGAIAILSSCSTSEPDSQDMVLKLMQQRKCRDCDLGAVNLPDTDLSGVDLSGANLAGSNLKGANLSNAKLDGTNLSGANLAGANVAGTDLSKAITEGATLP